MRYYYIHLCFISIAAQAILSGAQVQGVKPAFYAEQRDEIWFPDGQHDEDLIKITRLANRSFLAVHPLHEQEHRLRHTGQYLVYFDDTINHVVYGGETTLGAAWPHYELGPSVPGRDPMVDQYGDCSLLDDTGIRKTDAGTVNGYSVLRVDENRGNELHTQWIAPELGCFPLRSQVLVDGLVRERVDTVKLELLPANTVLTLPKGIRVISPQAYCDLYKEHYGRDYLPQRLCSQYQLLYEQFTAKK